MIGNRNTYSGRGGSDPETIPLNITPMMDILTALLFFLLANMASQSYTMETGKGLVLPASISEKALVITLKVTATLDSIKIEESPVVVLKRGRISKKHVKGEKIIPLYNALKRVLEQKRAKGLEVKEDSIVLLMADKRIKSSMITKIMKTCGMAGIVNFHFGVQKA